MIGTPSYGTVSATSPSRPNPGSTLPVFAFKRDHLPACGEDDALRIAAISRPISNATERCHAAVQFVTPDLFTGIRFQRYYRSPAGKYITPFTTIGVIS